MGRIRVNGLSEAGNLFNPLHRPHSPILSQTTGKYTEQKWKLDTLNFCDQIFNIRYEAMIPFFCINTTKHLDIRRDIKKISPVGCCIDKLKKESGYVKIRFTGLRSGLRDGQLKTSTP